MGNCQVMEEHTVKLHDWMKEEKGKAGADEHDGRKRKVGMNE